MPGVAQRAYHLDRGRGVGEGADRPEDHPERGGIVGLQTRVVAGDADLVVAQLVERLPGTAADGEAGVAQRPRCDAPSDHVGAFL